MMNSAATMAFELPTSFGLTTLSAKVFGVEWKDSPKEKLTVQVTDIDRIHVYYMDVLETGQSEVGQDFASESTSTNDQDLALFS